MAGTLNQSTAKKQKKSKSIPKWKVPQYRHFSFASKIFFWVSTPGYPANI